jgi:glycosyltransferase involved in cell wall biosynthesis
MHWKSAIASVTATSHSESDSEKSTLTIAFIPEDSGSNAYAARMQEILGTWGRLETFGVKVRVAQLLKGRFRRVDLLIVNWMENMLVSRKTRRLSGRGALKLLFKMISLRIFARRMVFVRHNLYPHATNPKSAGWAQWLIDRYESMFDLVFLHSGADAVINRGTGKRHYLPHPLYRPLPNPSDRAGQFPSELPKRYFIIFGRIVPYKGIEALMTLFPDSETLVVCGEVGNETYARKLAGIKRPNILYWPGYMSEAAAQELVRGAQAVVIASAEPNMMVSGTFFYAISLHRHVFAVRTPFLDWIAPRLGPDTLTLADDLPGLCRVIERSSCSALSEQSQQIVQHEFGDRAVRSAISAALQTDSR